MAKIAVIVGSIRSDRQGIKSGEMDREKLVNRRSHRIFHRSSRIEITFAG